MTGFTGILCLFGKTLEELGTTGLGFMLLFGITVELLLEI